MKLFIKNNIKFIIVIVICLIGSSITTLATNYIFNSNEVSYDNSESGLHADSVQGAIDEVFQHATDYSNINTRLTNVENQIYPVGSIYISVNSTNPSTLFGGTWEAFGQGRTLIGVGSNGTDTYAINNTGGASTHSISVGNLPVHNHSIPALSGSTTAVNNTGSTTSDGSHSHKYGGDWAGFGAQGSNDRTIVVNSSGNDQTYGTKSAGAHTHKLNIPSLTVTTTASNTNGCTNCSGTALSTIDPYITVYMWKRTA